MRFLRHLWLLLLTVPAPLSAQNFCEAVAAEPLVNPTVLGNGTPGSVTTAALQSALTAGGHILFNVGASPTTLIVASTLVINRPVVLDGAGVVTLSGGNVRRILQITNTQNQVYAITLQNLGFANANVPAGRGGAIFKETGGPWQAVSLKLVNTTFSNNAAMLSGQDDGGGALYATGMDHVRIAGSSFTNNRGSNGGAVYSLGSRRVTVVDSVFTGNQAVGTGGNPGNGGNAGAIGIDGADRQVDICRTRFLANTSNAHGAGFFSVMYDATSRSRFEDVTFDGNRQVAATQHTGGAYVQGGPFAFERVTFARNEANGYGGLFVGPGASGILRNATFVENVARQGLGAAMGIDASAPVSIVNTTIANNVSTQAFAGGISIGPANQLRLTNVLLANNTGGNIFVNWNIQNAAAQDGGGNMQWPASRPSGGGPETPATPTTTFANPLLAASLADLGGHVPTLALSAGSPARNTGVSGAEVPATDARGVARQGAPDRGSFEFALPPVLSISDASVTEGDGGTQVLTFTVTLASPAPLAPGGSAPPLTATEAQPSLAVADTRVEGDAAREARFTVTLSQASASPVTVRYATVADSATAGSDFGAVAGVLLFPPGVLSRHVSVPLPAIRDAMTPQTFFLELSAPHGARLGDPRGTCTLVPAGPR